ncbi:MAG: amidohydrolase family protein [Bacteroidales bacterium]|jgi:cytosine/adenosine deaminase-related metal-dependent hydrolase|nr:amidohydrolase family protein [Bacteroidales bacterium]
MRRIAANYIFPVTSGPLKNGIVELDEQGTILAVIDTKGELSESRNLEFYNGILVPGFVNSHCHLELSALQNAFPGQQGLPYFIEQMITYRRKEKISTDVQSMKAADQLMFQNGIAAVGDIVNTPRSLDIKRESKIYYHTFVEVSGMGPDVQERFHAAAKLREKFVQYGLSSSVVPHAPYSVSDRLFEMIKQDAVQHDTILSMHNQESREENKMFVQGEGKLIDTLKAAGINLSHWQKSGKTSLETILGYLPPNNHILFVHNLYSTAEEIRQVCKNFSGSFFVLCPLSNVFLENRVPDLSSFRDCPGKIALGTDSLASNRTLSVLDEMKILVRHNPDLAFQELLPWASYNGARALKIDSRFGSLQKGKSPGLNLITSFDFDKMQITEDSTVKRIV